MSALRDLAAMAGAFALGTLVALAAGAELGVAFSFGAIAFTIVLVALLLAGTGGGPRRWV